MKELHRRRDVKYINSFSVRIIFHPLGWVKGMWNKSYFSGLFNIPLANPLRVGKWLTHWTCSFILHPFFYEGLPSCGMPKGDGNITPLHYYNTSRFNIPQDGRASKKGCIIKDQLHCEYFFTSLRRWATGMVNNSGRVYFPSCLPIPWYVSYT